MKHHKFANLMLDENNEEFNVTNFFHRNCVKIRLISSVSWKRLVSKFCEKQNNGLFQMFWFILSESEAYA